MATSQSVMVRGTKRLINGPTKNEEASQRTELDVTTKPAVVAPR